MYILWIRHGFSSANYLKEVDPFYIITGTFENDAKLMPIGHIQGSNMGSNIVEMVSETNEIIPIIFSSILTRAIQTANEIKNGLLKKDKIKSKLIVIPYVEEIPLSPYLSIDRQNQPRNAHVVMSDTKIKFDVIGSITPYNRNGDPILRSNIKKFFSVCVPKIIKYISANYVLGEKSTIVIVSHRKAIEKATGISVGNIGAVLQNLLTGKSELIFSGYSKSESID